MAEREGSKDRSRSRGQYSSAGLFMGLFGGGGKRAAPPSTTRAHATPGSASSASSQKDPSNVDSASPRSGSISLPPLSATGEDALPTPAAPFDLHQAMDLMQAQGSTGSSSGHLEDIVDQTASYLANLLIPPEGDFAQTPSPEAKKAISMDDIKTLYTHAASFADAKSDHTLRTSAIRLLAALIATHPPAVFAASAEQANVLPDGITSRRLYQLIVAPTAAPGPPASRVEAVFVEVGALKALTNNGKEVSGLDGIVGWLVRQLTELKDEFAAWCARKDEDIKTTPCDACISIIELLNFIVINHVALFSPADVNRVVQPIIDLVISGIAASTIVTREDTPVTQPARRVLAGSSSTNSPAGSLSFPGSEPRGSLRSGTGKDSSHQSTPKSVSSPPPSSDARVSDQARLAEARWTRPIPALCDFLDALIEESFIPDELFQKVLLFLCLCFGQDETENVADSSWTELCDVLDPLLSIKAGRRGEQTLVNILNGTLQLSSNVPEADRKITRGAVISSRTLLQHLTNSASDGLSLDNPPWFFGSNLCLAQSTSRFPGEDRAAERARWQPVDYEILALWQDHIAWMENVDLGSPAAKRDVWSEGQAACDVLNGMLPIVNSSPAARRNSLGADDVAPLRTIFDQILHALPRALGRLHPTTTTAPFFYHPRYIDLLLNLAPNVSEEDASVVVDYYRRECLCLPFTSGWIRNIWKLVTAFHLPLTTPPATRRKVTDILFHDVLRYAEDLPEHRNELVEKVVLPFLERVLIDETDEVFYKEALTALVAVAAAETTELDEERRRARARISTKENEEEDAAPLPSEAVKRAASGGSFDAIRRLLIKLATQTACKEKSKPFGATSVPATNDSQSVERRASVRSREGPSTFRGIMEAISPPSKLKELPSVASVVAEDLTSTSSGPATSSSPIPPKNDLPTPEPHVDCRSLSAVTSLISIFIRLAFAPPHSFGENSTAARTPASSRCITIFRDLLGLLYPMADDKDATIKIPARCPRARLVILQLLVRLRADTKHRIYVRRGLNAAIEPFAAILKRTRETEKVEVEEMARRSARSGSGRSEPEERGRASRIQVDTMPRSRSRSKQPGPAPAILRGGPDQSYHPLWRVPEEMLFEFPFDTLPSEGMTTYDPNHPSLKDPSAPPVEGVWLPVSEYVRVLNGILRGHDWELVSYLFTFLPMQLSNKLFFHGKRATTEVRALLDVLTQGVTGTGGPWERRFNVPPFIKRADINAAAYQSLSILISYRGVFTRPEMDRLVQSFIAGLQGREVIAKPCLQALTVCVFELEQSVSRNLIEILRGMTNILSTTGLAVHILEYLLALGQHTTLIRNFTDEQYRLVFRIAISYIYEHNARSDSTVDLSDPATREAFILSQHVIGLAYYAIYIWFMALRLPQRPTLVTEITREILKGRSQRVVVDEMAEICFDWLARYTYGNADPKPATSFLSEMVMKGDEEGNPKSQSWILGGAIMTVTTQPRSGWATVTTTRPTGTTQIVCKIENIPLVQLGEANADLISLPAILMANRDPKYFPSGPGEPDPKDIVDQGTAQEVPPQSFDQSSKDGFIWSGATPSQRRKDVVVEPSYLGIQLLSSYPVASLEAPRGRLIPNEDKYLRALRGIQNTPVIDTLKIAVLYVAPGQTTETEILGNIDGSPLYLDFLSGLGRLIRLKGQVDVFVGGLNRDNDLDGEYAYAWWDDLSQVVFHAPTMMPNLPEYPTFDNKKRLVGNDYVKIVYNDSGKEFKFDTIRTAWNFINIIISPYNTSYDEHPGFYHATGATGATVVDFAAAGGAPSSTLDDGWADWDRDSWFKVTLQRADGIPDFGPLGTHKLVSHRALPIVVRQLAHNANDLAARVMHIRDAPDAASAEYITSWRSRLRGMHRLNASLPPDESSPDDPAAREQMIRDFTRMFTYRPLPPKEE